MPLFYSLSISCEFIHKLTDVNHFLFILSSPLLIGLPAPAGLGRLTRLVILFTISAFWYDLLEPVWPLLVSVNL